LRRIKLGWSKLIEGFEPFRREIERKCELERKEEKAGRER